MLKYIILAQLYLGLCECTYKRWVPNTNFNNPLNWDLGRVPCGNDKVSIPDESPVIFVQTNTTLEELTLPTNGEIILGSDISLGFTSTSDSSCPNSGSNIDFNATYAQDWFDPINWCSTDNETGACAQRPLLDTESIPCQNDDVIFPRRTSFFTNVETNQNIKINTLKISGVHYTTTTFRSYLSSADGQRQFTRPGTDSISSFTIIRRPCTNPTGCACGNEQTGIQSAVCRIQKPRCTRAQCIYPVTPKGTCCSMCGGLLQITYGTGFRFNGLKNALKSKFLDGQAMYNDVRYAVSKGSDDSIQIVLADGDGEASGDAARAMKQELDNDIANHGMKYAVESVRLTVSGSPTTSMSGSIGTTSRRSSGTYGTTTTPAGSTRRPITSPVSMLTSQQPTYNFSQPTAKTALRKDDGVSSAGIAGITIPLVIIIVALVVIALVVYKRRTSGGLGPLFDKYRSNEEMPTTPGFSYVETPSMTTMHHSFDNPMYGGASVENEKQDSLELTDYATNLSGEESGFENPLYGAEKKVALYHDPSSVETIESETTKAANKEDKET